MGEIDTMAKAYLSDKMRFADAFNFSIYGGDYVIKPDTLSPMDTTAIALPYGTNAAWENGINQARNDGFNNGFNNGEAKGRDTTMVNNIRNLMETSGWDAQKTMDALKIPASEQEKYARQI